MLCPVDHRAMPMMRRTFLAQALAGAGLLMLRPTAGLCAHAILIPNITGLYAVEVARVAVPMSTADVALEVRSWPGKIAVGGGRYSMGGQTAVAMGLHLDMRRMNKLIQLDRIRRIARVQAGMSWRDLQDILDPLGLAVQTMQSYANFTVGGTVSVNGHGRYVGHGPVGNSVRALQLVLADGSIREVSRTAAPELFRAAIGGYGAVGVITEVELDLAVNCRIERVVTPVALDAYPGYFTRLVRGDKDCILHNADLLPPHFDAPVAVSWRRTDKALTERARLTARGQVHAGHQHAILALTELPGGMLVYDAVVYPLLHARPVVQWRNHEASLDVAELEPRTRTTSTYVLQEYFIPVPHFVPYARQMSEVIRKHDAQVLNVSIRHADADPVALLPWAKEDVFSFVVYYKQRTDAGELARIGNWTRDMIETALRFEGRYYLPYQLHATRAQFDKAYPEAAQLRELKRAIDPAGKFSNELWRKYL
jgi:FAD/FMN-containing dehydrogenase